MRIVPPCAVYVEILITTYVNKIEYRAKVSACQAEKKMVLTNNLQTCNHLAYKINWI